MRYLLSTHQSLSRYLVAVPSAIAVMFSGLNIGVPEVKAQTVDQCSAPPDSSVLDDLKDLGKTVLGEFPGGGTVVKVGELYAKYFPEWGCYFLVPDPAYGNNPDAQKLFEECLNSYKKDNSSGSGYGSDDSSGGSGYGSDNISSSAQMSINPYNESEAMCMAP